MAQQVNMFRADSGKVFDSEHEALRDDLHHMLTASGHINDASATKFVDWVCTPSENLETLGSLLNDLHLTHPEAPQPSPVGTLPVSPLDIDPSAYMFGPGDFNRVGTNTGHGHAWQRPDGVKARCGGAFLCKDCKRDAALVAMKTQRQSMTPKQMMRHADALAEHNRSPSDMGLVP